MAVHMPQYGLCDLLGRSRTMAAVRERLALIATTDAPVLITGEPGTGQEAAARVIHTLSQRFSGPFVVAGLTVVPEVRSGGTLYIHEVGSLSLPLQAKLLEVLKKRDVRVIAATNRSLADFIRQGRFQPELHSHLTVATIHLPPLREHLGDISILAAECLFALGEAYGRSAPRLAPAVLRRLEVHSWPGNLCELRSVMEYAFTFVQGPTIRVTDLPSPSAICLPTRGRVARL